MNSKHYTPHKTYIKPDFSTPPSQITFSQEMKKVLQERNLLTAKTRNKVCQMLDSSDEDVNCEKNKLIMLRRQAVAEILSSEKSYIKQLDILITYFVNPLKSIIDLSTHMILFGQIEMIYNLNKELLTELESDLDSVATAFLKLAPFFKLYSVYAFDYKLSLLTLQELSVKHHNFKKFLLNTECRPEVQTKLNSLLICPIQRVPRYRLLLQQVLLYTKPSDIDYKIIQDSIKQIENTVSHIDSVIEDQEHTQALINLQNSLTNKKPGIVKPSRKIIKEGILTRISSNGTNYKRYCILMSDIFMYCKILKDRPKNNLVENSLKCSCIFPLKKCKVTEIFPGNFKLSCFGDGTIFSTDDINLCKSWITILRETIDLHIQCRKTLRKESSKRKPLRKTRDVNKFEIESNTKVEDFEHVHRFNSSSESESENTKSTKNCFHIKGREKLKRKIKENDENNSVVSPIKIFGSPKMIDLSLQQKANQEFKDMFFPLGGGGSGGSKNVDGGAEGDGKIENYTVPKKRVKFELENNKYNDDGYSFPRDFQSCSDNQSNLSFREKVTRFFASFF